MPPDWAAAFSIGYTPHAVHPSLHSHSVESGQVLDFWPFRSPITIASFEAPLTAHHINPYYSMSTDTPVKDPYSTSTATPVGDRIKFIADRFAAIMKEIDSARAKAEARYGADSARSPWRHMYCEDSKTLEGYRESRSEAIKASLSKRVESVNNVSQVRALTRALKETHDK